MNRLVMACMLSAAVSAGCSHLDNLPPGAVRSKPCKKSDTSCTVVVSATESNGVCTVGVDYDEVIVESGNENAILTWTLDQNTIDAGYRFAKYGVVFLDVDPKDQWNVVELHHGSDDRRIAQWKDKNKNDDVGAKYPYLVLLAKPLGNYQYMKCLSPDPWIHNQ
jgi:hypothetical protein